mmetsp:Transcript_79266/g.222456  ORF Transcript_79266/g.222456 Transcript_79266/m.222456 type:complete len:144 (-) Transcript_79266:222-653(-)
MITKCLIFNKGKGTAAALQVALVVLGWPQAHNPACTPATNLRRVVRQSPSDPLSCQSDLSWSRPKGMITARTGAGITSAKRRKKKTRKALAVVRFPLHISRQRALDWVPQQWNTGLLHRVACEVPSMIFCTKVIVPEDPTLVV